METIPSLSSLFNMQSINCPHDKLQPSQLYPCDIYTRVVYKHRCGNIIRRENVKGELLLICHNESCYNLISQKQQHIWHMC